QPQCEHDDLRPARGGDPARDRQEDRRSSKDDRARDRGPHVCKSHAAGILPEDLRAPNALLAAHRQPSPHGRRLSRRLGVSMPRRLPCLESLLAAVKAAGFDGINVTFPCKQTVIPLLDEMLSEAQLSVIMIVAALVLPPINVGATD